LLGRTDFTVKKKLDPQQNASRTIWTITFAEPEPVFIESNNNNLFFNANQKPTAEVAVKDPVKISPTHSNGEQEIILKKGTIDGGFGLKYDGELFALIKFNKDNNSFNYYFIGKPVEFDKSVVSFKNDLKTALGDKVQDKYTVDVDIINRAGEYGWKVIFYKKDPLNPSPANIEYELGVLSLEESVKINRKTIVNGFKDTIKLEKWAVWGSYGITYGSDTICEIKITSDGEGNANVNLASIKQEIIKGLASKVQKDYKIEVTDNSEIVTNETVYKWTVEFEKTDTKAPDPLKIRYKKLEEPPVYSKEARPKEKGVEATDMIYHVYTKATTGTFGLQLTFNVLNETDGQETPIIAGVDGIKCDDSPDKIQDKIKTRIKNIIWLYRKPK